MPKSRIEIYSFKRQLVRRKYIVELDEKQLRHILSGLSTEQNVMNINEDDFLEYPDGRGPICTRIELMGTMEEMRRLQRIVGGVAYNKGLCGREVEACVVTNGRSGDLLVTNVRTVP